MCASLVVHAKDGHFTWVDERGQTHSAVLDQPPSSPDTAKSRAPVGFKTEEQLQQELKQRDKDRFFIWVDDNGMTHSQPLKQTSQPAANVAAVQSSDAVFAPPFRKPTACCQTGSFDYENLTANADVVKRQLHSMPVVTLPKEQEKYRVWPLRVLNAQSQFVRLNVYHIQSPVIFMAFDAQRKALYQVTLKGQAKAATWSQLASQEFVVHLDDAEIAFLWVLLPLDIAPSSARLKTYNAN